MKRGVLDLTPRRRRGEVQPWHLWAVGLVTLGLVAGAALDWCCR